MLLPFINGIGQGISSLLIGFIILVIIGAIIIWVIGVLIAFIPAFIIAGVVWWLTGNEMYAGVAFLLVALLFIFRR
jgi:hypothetical protein